MNQLKEKKMPPKYSKKYQKEALEDFRIACISREASVMGRKEVLTGKAKFGIFGAGKEIAQSHGAFFILWRFRRKNSSR